MCCVIGGKWGCGSGHSVDRGGTVGDMLTSTAGEGILGKLINLDISSQVLYFF